VAEAARGWAGPIAIWLFKDYTIVPTRCVSNLAPPPDDGAICVAFDELRTKIAIWAKAVARVDSRLTQRSAELDDAGSVRAERSDGGAIEQAQLDVTADSQGCPPAAEMEIAETGKVAGDASAASSVAARSVDEAVTARDATATEEGCSASLSELLDEAVDRPAETGDVDCQQDESLLAALTAEAAEAIRVEYRLFGGQRSFRNLIEAHREDVAEPQEQRHWWQRGKK